MACSTVYLDDKKKLKPSNGELTTYNTWMSTKHYEETHLNCIVKMQYVVDLEYKRFL
jgi:hypothetical protein